MITLVCPAAATPTLRVAMLPRVVATPLTAPVASCRMPVTSQF